MSSNEADRDLQSNGSSKDSASQAENNSANGSSGDEQNGSSPYSYLGTGSPMDVSSVSPAKSEGSGSFVHISKSETEKECTFADLMRQLRNRHYNCMSATKEDHLFEAKSSEYFQKDYICEVISNDRCDNYPKNLLIPVAVKENECEKAGSAMDFDRVSYIKLVTEGFTARVRARYPVPVILFDNKYICRSGTVANKASAAYNQATQPPPSDNKAESDSRIWLALGSVARFAQNVATGIATIAGLSSLKGLYMKDFDMLEALKVEHLCDLMVEYAKVYKDFVEVSSSEIVNKDVYRTIQNEDMPYPGCEFFKTYCKNDRSPEGLKFDFKKGEVTRQLVINDKDLKMLIPDLKYEEDLLKCDVVEITKNYLKIMLALLVKDKGGILVHCISGWDRTPLFISLLRLSLWADGVIHQSLDSEKIAYLTVAYDWYLFGHDFPTRYARDEEIMHFCFNFLSCMTTDEFSITKMFKRLPAEARANRPSFPDYEAGRRKVLSDVREYVLKAYEEYVIGDLPFEKNAVMVHISPF